MGVVTCGGCGLKFNRSLEEAEFIKSKWYHKGCAITKHEKMELDAYICKLFGLKTAGPMNNILIKKFREQMGYNYNGMLNALKYYYEVKKRSTNRAEERVGIIPYVYQEAQEYYQRIEEQTRRIGDRAVETKAEEIQITLCSSEPEKKVDNKNELDSLFDDEE